MTNEIYADGQTGAIECENQSKSEQIGILEFCVGFAIGSVISVFCLYLLPYMGNSKGKRRGMYFGCLTSFVALFFIGLSLACYSSYGDSMKKENAARIKRGLRAIAALSFVSFTVQSIKGLFMGSFAKEKMPIYVQERRLRKAGSQSSLSRKSSKSAHPVSRGGSDKRGTKKYVI